MKPCTHTGALEQEGGLRATVLPHRDSGGKGRCHGQSIDRGVGCEGFMEEVTGERAMKHEKLAGLRRR